MARDRDQVTRARNRAGRAAYGGIAALVVLLNIAAWNSTAFCDWYIAHIFPLWVGSYGRLTGLFPFSVGEWLLAAGVLLVVLAAILGLLWAGIGLSAGCGWLCRMGRRPRRRRSGGFLRFSRGFGRFFAWTLLIVSLVMTLNCFILYHASTFSEHYFGKNNRDSTLAELIQVYNRVAGQCNRLSQTVERDAEGMAVYPGGVGGDGKPLDMEDMARELMGKLGKSYPQLDGYYPRPKALLSSDFMCQQYMQGYYFPFSMEANYNNVMHILNFPATMCHELAHLRGYIYEDEANFISYLACVESEDAFFQYSGYLSVLGYLSNDLRKARKENPTAYEEATAKLPPVTVDTIVWEDNVFVTEAEWERIHRKSLFDTETVDKAADVFIDTNLKVNGISDGKISYSRVVRLLLQYYFQK